MHLCFEFLRHCVCFQLLHTMATQHVFLINFRSPPNQSPLIHFFQGLITNHGVLTES